MARRAPVLCLVGVSHRYGLGPPVLNRIDLEVTAGEAVALMGPSGSGKTTLLSIIGLLTVPAVGTVVLDGEPLPTSGRQRFQTRSRSFSWIFQTVNVLGSRTAADNVALGLLARGVPRPTATHAAAEALTAVGLADRAADRVVDLSGGELQRVCVARAVAAAPRVLLADEPTGQLDHATSIQVLDAIWAALRPETTLIVATHDPTVAQRCSRTIDVVDGRLIERNR